MNGDLSVVPVDSPRVGVPAFSSTAAPTDEIGIRLHQLFEEALKRSGDERTAFLAAACPDIRALVERLLMQDELAGKEGFLDAPLWVGTQPLKELRRPEQSLLGRRVGPYEVREWIASGGMGSVYRAVRVNDFRQQVAIKFVRTDCETESLLARFETERQALAELDHPHIARILDAGTTNDGRPYYVMEFVDGHPIDRYCEERQISLRDRVELFLQVCEAVDHAHQRGVAHRDLKPANILVTSDRGVKLTDFGMARLREQDVGLTKTGDVIGTPSYMSPEQSRGDPRAVGYLCDQFALGAILYELLTGRLAFKGANWQETLEQVCRCEPARPRSLQRNLPRDLETITLKCLREEPQRRYANLTALVDDVRRYLAGRAIAARRIGTIEHLARWCRRHPSVAALLFGLLVVTLIGALGVFWQWHRAEQNYANTRALLYAANMKLAEAAWKEGNIRAVHQLLEPFGDSKGQTDLRGWEWYYFRRLCNQDVLTIQGTGRVHFLSARQDDASVLVGTSANSVWSFDKKSGAKELNLMLEDYPITAAKSDDGLRIAGLNRLGIVKIWTVSPSRLTDRIELGGAVRSGAFTSDLSRLAVAGEDLKLRIWDLTDRLETSVLTGHTAPITSVRFSADEKQLISGGEDGTVRIWDLEQGTQIVLFEQPERSWILTFTLSNDGKLLAAGCRDGSIVIWDISSRQQVLHLVGHTGSVNSLAFSANDQRLVSGGADRTIRVWEMPGGAQTRTFRGHLEPVNDIEFLHNSNVIISGSSDETVRLWDLNSDDFALPRPRHVKVKNGLFSDDGLSMACRYTDGTVIVFGLPTWRELYRFSGPPGQSGMAYDAKRERIAVTHADATVELWQGTDRIQEFRGHTAAIRCLALSKDGRWLASGSLDRTLKIWDVESGRLRHDSPLQPNDVLGAAFSPDSKLLVSTSDGDISFWDPSSGSLQRRLQGHKTRTYGVSFNETGELLATGDAFGTVHVWDAVTGKRRATLPGHTDRAYASCFAPGSRRLISCSRDGTIRWWDLTTSRELCVIQGAWGSIEDLALSPDGWTLAAKNEAGELRLWDPRP